MFRKLYRDHWLLGVFKDTMPLRKWFRFFGGAFAASLFATHKVKGQSQDPLVVSGNFWIDIQVDEGGAPESWEGSHPLSPFSLANVITGNLFTQIPIVAFSGRGLDVSLTLFHNSSSASSLLPFGYGWTHSYRWRIDIDPLTEDAILTRETGKKHRYTYDWLTDTYIPPAGIYDDLVRNSDNTWTLTFKNQTKMHFAANGRLNSIVDPNGNRVTLSYDASGRLTQVQEASGKVLSLGYQGTDTKVRTITDPRGKVWQFSYNALNDLSSITDPMGFVFSFSYDSNHRITAITDKRGKVWSYGYDANGKVVFAKHPDTGTTQISLAWDNLGVTITDQDNITVRYEKTSAGELGKVIAAFGTLNLTTTYNYDSKHNITKVTTPRNNVWQYGYDGNGNLTSVKDPLNRTTTMTYDSKNNLTSVTTPSGKTTSYEYDAKNNLIKVTDALGNITNYTYDAYGNRTSQTIKWEHDFVWLQCFWRFDFHN